MLGSSFNHNKNYQNMFDQVVRGTGADASHVRELMVRLDRLEIVAEATWNLLKKKTGLSDSALIEEMVEIDLSDGHFDGRKKTPTACDCTKCGRKNNKYHSRCIYCGTIIVPKPFG